MQAAAQPGTLWAWPGAAFCPALPWGAHNQRWVPGNNAIMWVQVAAEPPGPHQVTEVTLLVDCEMPQP